MGKVRMATVWLDGCSGCHMSLLDMDERLLAARRGRTGFATRADGLMHTTSNVRETDLVARAIGVAWREGQIDPFEPSTAAQSFSSSRSGA